MSESKSNQLRQILAKPDILVVPAVYDCLSGKIAEQVGFDAVFTSGFGIAASTLGLPDYGFLTATEMLYSVSRINNALSIPLVADIDTGYGNALNVIHTVNAIVKNNIAGIILEDQEAPKKCGHMMGKRVISMNEHVSKIKAAIEARGDSDLVIIARTDARAVLGLDEALKRGKAYRDAGADVIFIEAPESVDELKAIAKALPDVPLFANIIEGGKTPQLTGQEVQELGFKICVFPLTGLFSATKAMINSFKLLKETGSTASFDELVSFQEFEDIIDVPKFKALEEKYN